MTAPETTAAADLPNAVHKAMPTAIHDISMCRAGIIQARYDPERKTIAAVHIKDTHGRHPHSQQSTLFDEMRKLAAKVAKNPDEPARITLAFVEHVVLGFFSLGSGRYDIEQCEAPQSERWLTDAATKLRDTVREWQKNRHQPPVNNPQNAYQRSHLHTAVIPIAYLQ